MDLRLGWVDNYGAVPHLAFYEMEREYRCHLYDYKSQGCPGCEIDQGHSSHKRRLRGSPSDCQRQCGFDSGKLDTWID